MQSQELAEKVNHLLEKLIFFYKRAKERKPKRAKKRVICGMNEIRNKRDLLKGLLVATNIEYHSDSERPGLNDLIKDITSFAEEDGVPVVHVGTVKSLAKAVHKGKGSVSAVGVLEVEGCRGIWNDILTLAERLREERMMAEADYLPISNTTLKEMFEKQNLLRAKQSTREGNVGAKGEDGAKKKTPAHSKNPNSKATAKS